MMGVKIAEKISELSAIEVRRIVTPGMHFVGGVPGLALQVLLTGGELGFFAW